MVCKRFTRPAVPRIGSVAVLVGIIAGLWLFDQIWPDALTSRKAYRIAALVALAAPALLV